TGRASPPFRGPRRAAVGAPHPELPRVPGQEAAAPLRCPGLPAPARGDGHPRPRCAPTGDTGRSTRRVCPLRGHRHRPALHPCSGRPPRGLVDCPRRRGAPLNGAQPSRTRRLPHRVGNAGPAGPPGPRERVMSAWQVYKFGGSSLGAAGRLPVVLRRVAEAPRPLALVVSALGDSTEWLLDAGRAAASGDETLAAEGAARAFSFARDRAAELLDARLLAELEGDWSPIVIDASRSLDALSSARDLVPSWLDLLLSVGER